MLLANMVCYIVSLICKIKYMFVFTKRSFKILEGIQKNAQTASHLLWRNKPENKSPHEVVFTDDL